MLLELIRFKNNTRPYSWNWSKIEMCGLVIPEVGELVSQTQSQDPKGTQIYQEDASWLSFFL